MRRNDEQSVITRREALIAAASSGRGKVVRPLPLTFGRFARPINTDEVFGIHSSAPQDDDLLTQGQVLGFK